MVFALHPCRHQGKAHTSDLGAAARCGMYRSRKGYGLERFLDRSMPLLDLLGRNRGSSDLVEDQAEDQLEDQLEDWLPRTVA